MADLATMTFAAIGDELVRVRWPGGRRRKLCGGCS